MYVFGISEKAQLPIIRSVIVVEAVVVLVFAHYFCFRYRKGREQRLKSRRKIDRMNTFLLDLSGIKGRASNGFHRNMSSIKIIIQLNERKGEFIAEKLINYLL